MTQLNDCFGWLLVVIENHFAFSDDPKASRVIDQVLRIKGGHTDKKEWDTLADILETEG